MSGPSTWTEWMQSHPVARCKTPSCTRYWTGERWCAVTGMPRARSASANGPLPCCTSCVSALDSARCSATGRPAPRAKSATARYKGPLTVYGACGETRSEEHTSELQSLAYLVCRLLLEKKKKNKNTKYHQRTMVVYTHQ